MDKNVRPYKQRGDTCAIACMLMVLEYYKIIEKANWYDERTLYRKYGSKYMSGTPFSALAFYMSKKGLNVTIHHENIELFKKNQDVINELDFELAIDEYKLYLQFAEKKGAKILIGINIYVNLLKEKLEQGNLIILAGELTGGYHAVLLTGYNENNFIVCDPLYKNKQTRTFEEIEKYMDTSIGKWFIAVNDKNR